MTGELASDGSGASVHTLIKDLCHILLVPATVDDRALKRANATAYDRLLFWDGGDDYEEGNTDSRSDGNTHLLGVAAGVYSMRCAGREGNAGASVCVCVCVCACERSGVLHCRHLTVGTRKGVRC